MSLLGGAPPLQRGRIDQKGPFWGGPPPWRGGVPPPGGSKMAGKDMGLPIGTPPRGGVPPPRGGAPPLKRFGDPKNGHFGSAQGAVFCPKSAFLHVMTRFGGGPPPWRGGVPPPWRGGVPPPIPISFPAIGLGSRSRGGPPRGGAPPLQRGRNGQNCTFWTRKRVFLQFGEPD